MKRLLLVDGRDRRSDVGHALDGAIPWQGRLHQGIVECLARDPLRYGDRCVGGVRLVVGQLIT